MLRRRLVVRFVSLACVLITLEAISRFYRSETSRTITVADPAIGSSLKKSFDGAVWDIEVPRFVHLRTNEFGLRFSVDREPSRARILVIGDSFVTGLAVSEEDTFCGQLQSRLDDRHPRRWQVLNAGVPGTDTAGHVVLAKKLIPHVQPRVVVLAINAYSDISRNDGRSWPFSRIACDIGDTGDLEWLPMRKWPSDSRRHWLHQSRCIAWHLRRLRKLRTRVRRAAGKTPTKTSSEKQGDKVFFHPPSNSIRRAWTITEKLVKELRTTVRSSGAELVVLSLPSARQIHPKLIGTPPEARSINVDHPEAMIRAICRRCEVPCVSPIGLFHRSSASLFLHNRGHYNRDGHRLVASELARFFAQKSTFSRYPRVIPRLNR